MSPDPSAVTRGLIVAVSLLLVGGIAGAVTTGDDGKNESLRAGASTTTTAAAGAAGDGVAGPGDAAGGPATTTGGTGGSPGGGASSGGGTATAVPNPSALFTPPKDGTYTYKAEGGDHDGEEMERTVRTTSRANGETRQSITGQFDGNNGDLGVVWKGNGWTWERISAEGGGQSGDCSFTPPLHYLPQPVATGNTWSYDSTCTFTFGGQPATVRIAGAAKVTGAKVETVGGTAVDVWVIERSGNYDVAFGAMKTSAMSTSTELWAPAYGLDIRSSSTVKADGKEQSQTRYLTSLKPKQ